MGGLGGETKGGLRFADGAVVAPQFEAGKPGRYTVDVLVVGVPMSADKRPFFDLAAWNSSIASAGYSGVTVDRVDYVVTGAAANPRSSGGSWDVFGAGVPIADYTYRLHLTVRGPDGVAGLGAVTTAGWFLIAAAVVAVNLLVYKLTGTDVLVTTVRYLGQLVGATTGALATGALPALVPILVVVGLALLAFTKMGGRGSYKGFSIGK
jgi:hypothetical protein